MKNIECLVWSSDLAIGEDGNALVSRFLRKACELLEAEINEAGGVAKKNLTINYIHVPKGDEGVAQVLQTLESSPNILFLNGHSVGSHNTKILESLDLDSFIYFKSGADQFHPNLFNISRASQKTKSESIKGVLNKYGNDTRIIFMHDGKRMVQFEKDFLSPQRHNVSSINFAEFTTEDEIEKKLGGILPEINDDDILILDRMELKGQAFHSKVRDGFLEQAKAMPNKYRVIDSTKDEDSVEKAVQNAILEQFCKETPQKNAK